jgi:precorrin-6Y C5,15-methyltransferase (decarboxylating)
VNGGLAKICVLGLPGSGPGGLGPAGKARLESATFVAGGRRHLELCGPLGAETFSIASNLEALALRLKELRARPEARLVVLASGDPLYYGIARFLGERLGREALEVLPQVSALQLACARVGLPWDDLEALSVHGRPLEGLFALRPDARKVGVYTDPERGPARVAEVLLGLGWPGDARAWVLEDLEGPGARLWSGALWELEGRSFGEPNVLLAERGPLEDPRAPFALGLEEEGFAQRTPDKGLITKSEVRVLSLAKLGLYPGAVVWDVGAATGSVAIEASRLCRGGSVWAVEKNAESCGHIGENLRRFGAPSVRVLHGEAPAALKSIPDDPDAVFVGGSSGRLAGILDACAARLKAGGRVVVNTVAVENTAEALEWFGHSGLEWGFLQVQIGRGKALRTPTGDLHRLEALNPVHIFWGRRCV